MEGVDNAPTTVVGALIFIAVSLLGVVIWIVKRQFEMQERHAEKVSDILSELSLSLERILNHLQLK